MQEQEFPVSEELQLHGAQTPMFSKIAMLIGFPLEQLSELVKKFVATAVELIVAVVGALYIIFPSGFPFSSIEVMH
jgi:hypothetical protein